MAEAPAKKENPLTRWGGLIIVAAVVGGLVVGINLLTIGILVVGVVLVVVGLVKGKK